MTHLANLPLRILFAAGAGVLALLWCGVVPMNGPMSLISTAEARIGRPATPMSYAGVARRTTRRAVGYGAAAGAATAAGAGCVQVVNEWGQLEIVC
jgi:hypothetical protein